VEQPAEPVASPDLAQFEKFYWPHLRDFMFALNLSPGEPPSRTAVVT
jgi:hypothetical protein